MPIAPSPLPPTPPQVPDKTLGDKVRNTFFRAIMWVIDTVTAPFEAGLKRLTRELDHLVFQEMQKYFEPFLKEVDESEDMPDWLKKGAHDVRTATGSPIAPVVVMIAAMAMTALVGAFLTGPVRRFSFNMMHAFRPARPSYRDAIRVEVGALGQPEAARGYLRDMGFEEEFIDRMLVALKQWPTLGLVEEMQYRGVLDPPEAFRYIRHLGYDIEQAEKIQQTFDRLVSASDLQRFGIREVFTPELAEPLKTPSPGERYYTEMALLGFSRERAEWYWMAHWRLIAEGRSADIVRRLGRGGTIEGQDTKDWYLELLRRDDVLSKYWEPLWQTRYRVINRLDIWRLALAGAFDRDQVYELYLDYGYAPELASTMADAATSTRLREGTNLSRADIASGYQRGMFNRDEALAMLIDIGYTEDEAEFFLAKADLDSTTSNAASRASIVRQKFLTGLLDDAGAASELAALGKEAPEIDSLLSLWRVQKEDRLERPTISQLAEFYSRSIITGPVLRAEILGHGYSDRYTDWYITNIEAEIDERNARLSEAELRRKMTTLRQPTRSDLLSFYRAGFITIEDFTRRLLDQGYTQEDVAKYASLAAIEPITPFYKIEEGKLRLAALKEAVRRGLITPLEFRAGLANLAVPPELADAIADYEEVRLAAREERI